MSVVLVVLFALCVGTSVCSDLDCCGCPEIPAECCGLVSVVNAVHCVSDKFCLDPRLLTVEAADCIRTCVSRILEEKCYQSVFEYAGCKQKCARLIGM